MWYYRRMEKITWNDHVKKDGLQRVSVERNVLQTRKRRKTNLIGYILRRNCLLKQAIERKKEG